LDISVFEDTAFSGLLARRINQMLRDTGDDDLRFLWMDDIVPRSIQMQASQDAMAAVALVSEDGGKSFVHYRLEIQFGPASTGILQSQGRSAFESMIDTISDLQADRQAREIRVQIG
jgi:hypothetical protein